MSTMAIDVDMSACEHHAQCVLAAPKVFQLDDNGELAYDATPDISELGRVKEAIELCPVLAITISSEG
jgi:ferredoxin